MHPSLKRAYEEELLPFFHKFMLAAEPDGFGVLDTAERQEKMLAMLEDEPFAEKLREEWADKPQWSGAERWASLQRHVKASQNKKLHRVLTEVVFTYTYPRLDVNVSKGMNHLLKSPWCVHPKTGRVCVPVAVDECSQFDPSTVPTLKTIAEDLDAASAAASGKAISSTGLAKYEAAFDAFLRNMDLELRAERARSKEANMSVDF